LAAIDPAHVAAGAANASESSAQIIVRLILPP
jgi:hypothetical protein